MVDLIRPEQLPLWVPGDLTGDTASLGWEGVRLRGYRYAASDVSVPALSDYMIVFYEEGVTPMHRRCQGGWQSELVGPGSVSLLTQAAPSHWRWSERIRVSHLYVSPAAVAAVAAEVFERDIETVELFDMLNVHDPMLCHIAAALDEERREGGAGGRLYVDALRTQACVHIIRNYANVEFRSRVAPGGLSRAQRRRIVDFIEDNIGQAINLAEIAAVAQLGIFHLSKRFRAEFGCAPHTFVMRCRIEHAKRALSKTSLPLATVAENAGFFDQSHMNRMFRRDLDTTPAAYRKAMSDDAKVER
jgi:AraC family transcriptional regulator